MLILNFMTNFLMKKNNLFFVLSSQFSVLILCLVSCILYLVSCKEPDSVSLNQITGQKLGVAFTDTTKILAHSITDDSTRTNSTALNLVGNMVDPIFGKTTAEFYSQFQLTSTNVTFGTLPTLDSIVLTLGYNGYYGDVSVNQTVNVYEINDTMNYANTYYAFNKKNIYSEKIGSKVFIPKPKDSIKINGTKVGPHLRIKLNSAFGLKFLNSASTNLTDNASFIKFFNGLYINSDTTASGSSILYFNLLSTLTGITVFYRNTSDTTQFNYTFIVNTTCAKFNNFKHYHYDLAASDFKKQVLNKDTNLGNQVLYLQATGGVKTQILFPELKKLLNSGNIAINKAEFVIKPNIVLSGDTSIYKVPLQLALVRYSNLRKILLPPDYSAGASYFGGTYNKTKNEYRFSLSLYIQDLLNNRITGDRALYLLVDAASSNAGRIQLYGPKYLYPQNMRLEITYTRLGIKYKK